MYTVIGTLTSRTFRVLWALEELGQPYAHEPVPPHSERVMALNATGKIPVLLVDGAALTDSTAILTFLADRHGALTFPAGSVERARQDALTHRFLDEVEALVWTAARHSFILPPDHRVPAIKDSLRWELARNAARIETELAGALTFGPWLMGETFTIADILAVHCLDWAEKAKMPVTAPALLAYRDRAHARPAFRKVAGMMAPAA